MSYYNTPLSANILLGLLLSLWMYYDNIHTRKTHWPLKKDLQIHLEVHHLCRSTFMLFLLEMQKDFVYFMLVEDDAGLYTRFKAFAESPIRPLCSV